MKIELIYDQDCPNVDEARTQIKLALKKTGLAFDVLEWDRASNQSPKYVRNYGSPSILVNGKDVADTLSTEGNDCCRIYLDRDGKYRGVPSVETIMSSLKKAMESDVKKKGLISFLASLPAIGAGMLPGLGCPACWPAYAGLLSSAGIGFFYYTPYRLPLMALFLGVSIAMLGYRARNRRGYLPFVIGIFAVFVILLAKFYWTSESLMYTGIMILVGASIWNSWPRPSKKSCS